MMCITRSQRACSPFKESTNKGPHFWDEDHTFFWYTDVYEPIANKVTRRVADETGPLAIDASSNTFTVSGVNILGKPNRKVALGTVQRATSNLICTCFVPCTLLFVTQQRR